MFMKRVSSLFKKLPKIKLTNFMICYYLLIMNMSISWWTNVLSSQPKHENYMASFSLQKNRHAVWKRVIQVVYEVIWYGIDSCLAGIPCSCWEAWGSLVSSSSFIYPQICLIIFISGDYAGQAWRTSIFFTFRNFIVEPNVWLGSPSS